MKPALSEDCLTTCHPGQVRLWRTRAGIQEKVACLTIWLDSGSRLPLAASSGMTGSTNCDIISQESGDFLRS